MAAFVAQLRQVAAHAKLIPPIDKALARRLKRQGVDVGALNTAAARAAAVKADPWHDTLAQLQGAPVPRHPEYVFVSSAEALYAVRCARRPTAAGRRLRDVMEGLGWEYWKLPADKAGTKEQRGYRRHMTPSHHDTNATAT